VLAVAALVAGLVALSGLAVWFDVDRSVAQHFYDPGRGWPIGEGALWLWLYRYGTVPGLVLTLAALVGFALSFRSRQFRPWRRECLLIFLTAVIGGGLLVNAVFKPYWGRPRPRQVTLYGGQYDYREFYRPGIPGQGQSFPCGHCTMGFVFVSALALRRRAPAAALAGTGFGLAYGGLLGLCRIVQGAHFVTDVLWSFGILSLVAAVLHGFLLPTAERLEVDIGRRRQRLVAAGAVLAAALVLFAFLTRRPFFETHTEIVAVDAPVTRVELIVEGALESRRVRFEPRALLRLSLQASGFAWPRSRVFLETERHRRGETLVIRIRTKKDGYFSELSQQLQVTAPVRIQDGLSIQLQNP
jgi:membrane-associated PAP2 superfamily phosphatase